MEGNGTVVLTLRPDHKPGVYLLKEHYDAVSTFILSRLKEKEAMRLDDLIDGIKAASIGQNTDMAWVLLHVKSDLEAKKIINITFIKPMRTQIVNLNGVKKFWWSVGK